MEMAHVVAKRSTCPRLNVGALVVFNNRLISIGYNGAPAGKPHCTDVGCDMQHGHCVRTIHAEMNALHHVPQEFRQERGKDLYVTNVPCPLCATMIVRDGTVTRVFYSGAYQDFSSLGTMISEGIEVYRVLLSGYLVNHCTNEVIDAG
jgi:dCMP deaminase